MNAKTRDDILKNTIYTTHSKIRNARVTQMKAKKKKLCINDKNTMHTTHSIIRNARVAQ
jgi:hypothetical protein